MNLEWLTIGQKKALVTALVFGVKEVNGGAWEKMVTLGLIRDGALTEQGRALALKLVRRTVALNEGE